MDKGIRYVEAETILGAMYGLGFVHGQDRLWYLNFTRALARGTLSEILGSEAIQIDKLMRTIGITKRVE